MSITLITAETTLFWNLNIDILNKTTLDMLRPFIQVSDFAGQKIHHSISLPKFLVAEFFAIVPVF